MRSSTLVSVGMTSWPLVTIGSSKRNARLNSPLASSDGRRKPPVAPSRILAPVPRYSAQTVLVPGVVEPFLNGLSDLHPPSAEVEAVLEKARSGNYDAPVAPPSIVINAAYDPELIKRALVFADNVYSREAIPKERVEFLGSSFVCEIGNQPDRVSVGRYESTRNQLDRRRRGVGGGPGAFRWTAAGGMVTVADWPPVVVFVPCHDEERVIAGSLDAIEKAYIMWVLQSESGNKSRTAEVLGIDPSTLYRKLSRYGVEA